MNRPPKSLNGQTARIASALLLRLALGLAGLWGTVRAGDLLRGGAPVATAAAPITAGGSASLGGSALNTPSQDRLARTTQALETVKQMQTAARNLAIAGPNNLKANLPAVPMNSFGAANGLVVAAAVPKNLLNPTVGENALLWTGAKLPSVATQTGTDGATTSTVTIQQTQQQAILTWDSFNVGKSTTLKFDQSAGGTNVGQWIVFNRIGVTGTPSQILGSIQAQGQVYVINPNGFIFGGSSQVNTHALVASSLPINDGLIQRGLLNNPDAQFLFSSLPLAAGKNGTPAFTPVVNDTFTLGGSAATHTLASTPATAFSPAITYRAPGAEAAVLTGGTDYNLGPPDANGKVTVTFTTAGLQKIGSTPVNVAYTPLGDQYGNVVVQAGAQLTAPTNADHVGGRVALIGPNVTNAGTISTADGQTILTAGLQVGFAPHTTTDATLRGLDVYVGAVADPASTSTAVVGTATNAQVVNSDASISPLGLISAPRGDVTLTGQAVSQQGFIDSSTSVSYNGRVDLVAGFNAVPNPFYNPSGNVAADFTLALPFIHQSNSDNTPAGSAVTNSGPVTIGKNSTVRILPETADTDRVVGDLALPSQVNVQGGSIYIAPGATMFAPGAVVPLAGAFGTDGLALGAGITLQAGNWFYRKSTYQFVQTADTQQIYLDQGSAIDVSGLANVSASVAENIVAVELRGAELANSPLQKNGPLRGQTIRVDIRQHGAWDPKLNGGQGGYTWVGTPLANTAGWVGLATHSVAELSTNGGSVSLKAGGAVVLQAGSAVDVSGGSIGFQGGNVQTTKLTGADGHIYDIAKATPDLNYTGIYSGTTSTTDPKWGVTSTSANPLAQSTSEPGYIQGGNGGSLSISAPVVALDGTLRGNTVAGKLQQRLSPVYNPASPPDPSSPVAAGVSNWLLGTSSRPIPAELSIAFGRQYFSTAPGVEGYQSVSLTPANVVFQPVSALVAADAYNATGNYLFPTQRNYEFDLSPKLFDNAGSGFGILRLDDSGDDLGASPGYGNVTVKAGTTLALVPGGSLSLLAGNVMVQANASVSVPGGSVKFAAFDVSSSLANQVSNNPSLGTPAYDPTRGKITVAGGATVSTAGETLDYRVVVPADGLQPLLSSGGAGIVFDASAIGLSSGSVLDVSGGVTISTSGKSSYNNAGSISLSTGRAISVPGTTIGSVVGGTLNIAGADLRGYAGVGMAGGKLNLQADSILVKNLAAGALAGTDPATGTISLDPAFFNAGGFASFGLTGLGLAIGSGGTMTGSRPAVTIAAGVNLNPVVKSWQTLPGGTTFTAQPGLRNPARISFSTTGNLADINGVQYNNDTSFALNAGSSIGTDPGGSVTVSGGTIDILGTITALGGNISLADNGANAIFLPTVHLGPASVLDVSGTTAYAQDVTGYHKSDVLDGGTITVSGNIVAEGPGMIKDSQGAAILGATGSSLQGPGALLNVSGATDTILLPAGQPDTSLSSGSAIALVPVVKDSNGGTLTLTGKQELFSAATLKGTAGGPTAHAGALIVASQRSNYPLATARPDGSTGVSPVDPVLVLTAADPSFVYSRLGQAVTGATGTPYGDAFGLGLIRFGARGFAGGGFDALTLSAGSAGAIQVQGNVSFSASRQITIADGGVLSVISDPTANVAVKPALSLSAPYVLLGLPFSGPLQAAEVTNPLVQSVSALNGSGVLTVQSGSLIDVGTLSLQNVGTVLLDATNGGTSAGSIRGDGTLDVAGAVMLRAAQIYPPTAITFNVIANDYTASGLPVQGSITILPSGIAPLPVVPLSAGGSLNLYASNIMQGGVLRAPVGTINLGVAAGGGTDLLSRQSLPVTSTLTLQPGSVTSVSAIDPGTGQPVTIPYGITVNGSAWIDPTGTDITNVGPGAKSVTLTAASINLQTATSNASAASIDLSGGGDLFAYQFVPGTGGSTDILLGSTSGSFAVIPGYKDGFAPFAPNDTSGAAQSSLGSDPGYTIGNAKLKYSVGDRIHLAAGGGLSAGDYTLLPARYALLPGAFLVTPKPGATTAGAAPSVTRPDGAVFVSGYRFSSFDAAGQTQGLFNSFEVASRALMLARAQYDDAGVNAFFAGGAARNHTVLPRLPVDAGQLRVKAKTALALAGTVSMAPAPGGRGGLVDISSTADIVIGSSSVIAGLGTTSGSILLDATKLSSYGAASLLVGGTRTTSDTGTTVTVMNNNVTVDNAGAPLTGPDVILVANQGLTLANGAEIGKVGEAAVSVDPLQVTGLTALNNIGDSITFVRGGQTFALPSGTVGAAKLTATSSGTITTSAGTTTTFLATTSATGLANAFTVPAGATITLDAGGVLTLANSTDTVVKPIPVSLGDGSLLRVSSDPAAVTRRTGVTSSASPVFTLGTGVKLAGGSVTIDSTNTTTLPDAVDFSAIQTLALNSGRISVLLDQPGTVGPIGSLVLSRAAQQSLLKSVSALSLLSYTTLDFYGSGGFGASALGLLGLHAGTIRGFLNSADPQAGVNVAAKTMMLDNVANAATVAAAGTPAGTLTFDTGTLQLGGNQLEIQNFVGVTMNATAGVLTGDSAKLAAATGGLNIKGGRLSITAPLIAGAKGTTQSISTDGRLTLAAGTGPATVTPGLAASLSLTGDAVDLGTNVQLPSGTLTVLARTGDVTVSGAALDVGGTPQHFYDVTRFTDGGQIALSATAGNITIAAGSKVSVSADAAGGSAGSLALAIPAGNFTVAADTLYGNAGVGGQGGSFSLDTVGIPGVDPAASHLSTLGEALTAGGFNRSVALRVRQGNVIADGTIRAHAYALAADQGAITVTGTIDASGFIGSSPADPLGGTMDPADPTGGKIDLSASGSIILTPSAWLTAAGYSYNNAGKGGAISLSAGSYTYRGGIGQVDPTSVVNVQAGARIDLGVKNAFTSNDLLLNPGGATPVSTRTDFAPGTLHVRESQIAFGSGAQFAGLAGSVNGASGIVLEGFQVYDVTGTGGGPATTAGAITGSGSGGLIDSMVQNAIKANGTAFLAGASPVLLGNALFHVQPGAEIINNAAPSATVTRNFVTLNSSASTGRSLVNFNLKPGSGVFTTALIPGGLPVGVTLKTTTGRQFTLTTADGITSSLITATGSTMIASASAANPVVAINFKNTGATALTAQLNFNSGLTPLTVAFDTATPITSTTAAARYASTAGDLVLANTWDLSTYRFGTRLGTGNLNLRARGNLVLGFDASLSDGFDPTNPVDANNPLWTAQLMTGSSWSYRLVAGADYGAADPQSVTKLGSLAVGSGSILVGLGGLTLPTTTGTAATRSSIIPRYFQTVRTGTGNITISASQNVQFLNPLASVYTAGTQAGGLANFDVPVLDSVQNSLTAQEPYYPAQYSRAGGDVTITAQNDIARYVQSGTKLLANSSTEMPTNWLYRRSNVNASGTFTALSSAGIIAPTAEVQSTTWWIDFSNFFSDVGALGGGNVSFTAGHNVTNVNAVAPTNARMPGYNAAGVPVVPHASTLLELGGGNVSVRAGADISGGVYYVQRGSAALNAGGMVTTNATRGVFGTAASIALQTWLPTTFFLGQGNINVTAGGDILVGPVANPFWLPQGLNNRVYENSYFSTYDTADKVSVSSLKGSITLQGGSNPAGTATIGSAASLLGWYANVLSATGKAAATAASQPWLNLSVGPNNSTGTIFFPFYVVSSVLPGSLGATAFGGDIKLEGSLVLSPSPQGTVDLLAAGNIDGFGIIGAKGNSRSWGEGIINLSGADPARLPGITNPISFAVSTPNTPSTVMDPVNALFAETGATTFSLAQKLALNGQTTDASGNPVPLHYSDPRPLRLYSAGGDLSGLTLYSAKPAQVVAKGDITDIALYVQNLHSNDITLVAAGRDIIAYDPASPLRLAAQGSGTSILGTVGATGAGSINPNAGDIQIAGPGTLEVLAGHNIDLGNSSNVTKDGTAAGILSVGATRNPFLPQNSGANIIAAAGVGSVYSPAAAAAGRTPGLATTGLNFSTFIAQFLDPATAGAASARYLPELAPLMGLTSTDPVAIWAAFGFKPAQPLTEHQALLVQDIFRLVLRNSARDRNDPANPNFGTYKDGFAAITALFPGSPQPTAADLKSTVPVVRPAGPWTGRLTLSTREIKTFEGGDISLLVPGGDVTVGRATDPQKPDQGILTQRGGSISIFAADSVNVGTSRIFTLRGGDEIVWSTWGNVAAGSGSKTVFSAPPTRVLIDPQSGDVQNDLAGLATGSGIGVLATLSGVKPGDVDLIAPVGTIDAGDAGIRSSGNLNLAARVVLNAANTQAGGTTTGAPPPPPAPNIGALSAAATASAGSSSAAAEVTKQTSASIQVTVLPSLISVEVLGYGGEDEEDEKDKAGPASSTTGA